LKIEFVKYQGTGNDFILIDGRNGNFENLPVKWLCDRRYGIGADGLMILKSMENFDFEMIYYNSDGNISSMCGNGGRCISAWAYNLGLGDNNRVVFNAIDGAHEAIINTKTVALKMTDVNSWEVSDRDTYILNTGSPHYVSFQHENNLEKFDLVNWAKGIRYNDRFKQEGINVNLVTISEPNKLVMRTYERGVEDETLSCGTGVTAASLAYALKQDNNVKKVEVKTPGGDLSVAFERTASGFSNIWLEGPADFVFKGEIILK
jgi:diaminopimelate epimerase